MTDARHAELEQALQLSAQMLEAAGAGHWESVATLQAECDVMLRRDHPADDATRGILQTMQEQHLKLLELTASARDATGQELGIHRHNHRALSAYLESDAKR